MGNISAHLLLSSAETTPFSVDTISVVSSTIMAAIELRSVSTASTTSSLVIEQLQWK